MQHAEDIRACQDSQRKRVELHEGEFPGRRAGRAHDIFGISLFVGGAM